MMKTVALVLIVLFLPQMTGALFGFSNDSVPPSDNASNYQQGYRYNIQGWIYVHIEGNPYERGYQHGYLLFPEIMDMMYRWSNNIHNNPFILKYISINQSSDLYEKISEKWWTYCTHKVMDFFDNNYPAEYKQEIQGIADAVADRGGKMFGKQVSYRDILTLNEMFELLTAMTTIQKRIHPLRTFFYDVLQYAPSVKGKADEFISTFFAPRTSHHCSGFIATGDATTQKQIVTGQSIWPGLWWASSYIAQRWNVILDIDPLSGYRVMMSTSPGYIWSDENYYQNSQLITLVDTQCPQGLWKKDGVPLAIRSRQAAQYGHCIDEALHYLNNDNNGIWTIVWLIGDGKTGEIARFEQGLYESAIWRTKNGFYWSANHAMAQNVRQEQFRLDSLKGWMFQIAHVFFNSTGYQYYLRKYLPAERDIKFEELGNTYYGEIDCDRVKRIMSTPPISDGSADCKITDSNLVSKNTLWAFWGRPTGEIWNNSLLKPNFRGVRDIPPTGWTPIYGLPPGITPSFTYMPPEETTKGTTTIWTVDIGGSNQEWASGRVRNETLYISTNKGALYAIGIPHGTIKWHKSVGDTSLHPPTVYQNMVYAGSETLWAHDLSGKEKWHKTIHMSSPPIVTDETLVIGCNNGNLYGMTLEGKEMWNIEFDAPVYPTNGKKHLFATSGSTCYCIDTETKEILWEYETGGSIVSPPLLTDKILFCGSTDTHMYALDSSNGQILWKHGVGWGITSTPVCDDNTLFFGSLDNTFYALDTTKGKRQWSYTCQAAIQGSPTLYGDYVFFGSDDGKIYALNKTTGKTIWTHTPSHSLKRDVYNYITTPIPSHPTVDNGTMFIGAGGKIVALDTQATPGKPRNDRAEIPPLTTIVVILPVALLFTLTLLYYKRE